MLTTTATIASKNIQQQILVKPFIPVTASGGTGPLTYSIDLALPFPLAFNPYNGEISSLSYSQIYPTVYTVTVTDTQGLTSSKSFTLSIGDVLQFTTTTNFQSYVRGTTATNITPMVVIGGTTPYTFTISPDLPDGLVFNTNTGEISGTPKVPSDKTLYTIVVVDEQGFTFSYAFFIEVTVKDIISISKIQTPQFLNGTNLGTFKAGTTQCIPVTAYDPNPFITSPITYEIVNGTGPYDRLPAGMTLDTGSGYISGHINSSTDYLQVYNLTVNATKSNFYYNGGNISLTATNTFTLSISSSEPRAITWSSPRFLGTLTQGVFCDIDLIATGTSNISNIQYKEFAFEQNLPYGLSLSTTGHLIGIPANYGYYPFTIVATELIDPLDAYLEGPEYPYAYSIKEFVIDVLPNVNGKLYTNIYLKPLLSRDIRNKYNSFINSATIFTPSLMYRPEDVNFGVSTDLKFVLEYGIEQKNIFDYIPALYRNFYKRRLTFGDVKIVTVKNDQGIPTYDVVYVDIIDNIEKSNSVVNIGNRNVYPASVDNMRDRFVTLTTTDLNFSPVSISPRSRKGFPNQLISPTFVDDVYIGPVDLGFSWNMYGQTYTQLYLSTNGYLTFGGPHNGDFSPFGPLVIGSIPFPTIYMEYIDLVIGSLSGGPLESGEISGIFSDSGTIGKFNYWRVRYQSSTYFERFTTPAVPAYDFECSLYTNGTDQYVEMIYEKIPSTVPGSYDGDLGAKFGIAPANGSGIEVGREIADGSSHVFHSSNSGTNWSYVGRGQFDPFKEDVHFNTLFVPKFIKTLEQSNLVDPPYVKVMPLCYTLPGKGISILQNIKESKFNFKSIDFEVDRIFVEHSSGVDFSEFVDKYLRFHRQSLTDIIPED